MLKTPPHQFIRREDAGLWNEELFGDRMIQFLYGRAKEDASLLYRALTSRQVSFLLGYLLFDFPDGPRIFGLHRFFRKFRLDPSEFVDPPESFQTYRQFFERKIKYWEFRPMAPREDEVVAPADSKVLLGSLNEASGLFLKGKFFHFEELLGEEKSLWIRSFQGGDFALFRLTPEKYHYTHTPVAGRVREFYEIPGYYHSCNPSALISLGTPLSKNRRVVTIIDTDVDGGTGVGIVAMVEVVALMVGEILQCYSEKRYEDPRDVCPGMFLRRGCPKSLFRPGSSTVVLLFQTNRVEFAPDLIQNLRHPSAQNRFTFAFGHPLVETDVQVRSGIGRAASARSSMEVTS